KHFAYLDDHRIYGMPVLPFTAGLVALQQAARQHFGTEAVEIDNLQYREAMVLSEAGERVVQSILAPTGTDAADCPRLTLGVAHAHDRHGAQDFRAAAGRGQPRPDRAKMLDRHSGRTILRGRARARTAVWAILPRHRDAPAGRRRGRGAHPPARESDERRRA